MNDSAQPSHWSPVTTVRTEDPDRAESIVAELFLPNRLDLGHGRERLDMRIAGVRLGGLTVGRLSYGRSAVLTTAEADNFHVNVPLSGQARSWGAWPGGAVVTTPGMAAVFGPGRPAEIAWTANCTQLCMMISRSEVEAELETLLDRSLRTRLEFDPAMDLTTPTGRAWRELLGMLARELDHGPALVRHPTAGRHVRGLVIDGLLLGQHHTYTDAVNAAGSAAPRSAVARAIDLIHDRPDEPWSSVRLATEMHVSVRAMQEGFRREAGVPPMSYVREVRLHRARGLLRLADPGRTTVAQITARCGIGHPGRFAAAYRDTFGELPSQTLAAP
ncbi:AraC family transcriptional regulator [Nocardioides sp.]|uniref:AraC family transcriptional regulator n=1 Tax=Nocardioides sp. TaxID=35761 RepID=UPI002610BE0D|nr:AraC family transcriptional regulator [Nocardioides sp.]MCW2735725.1 Transcriptional regulator, AraC family [Nocardioides sp.]